MLGMVIDILGRFCYLLQIFIFIDVILSWMPSNIRHSKFAMIVNAVTEPMLAPVRKMIHNSPIGGGLPLDFSPFIVYLLIDFAEKIIKSLLISIF